ncbi:MAG TPA: 4Fe-4S dicluster domain-containing protein [bacterium]|nr:4Fe-4S dicluster domain-containing protein [bacterium]
MPETLNRSSEFLRRVMATETGKKLARCFACGTCSSGCPVHAQKPEFDPRKIIRMTLLGLEDNLLKSKEIWMCSTCYTCRERCPQEVGCAEIIIELRNIAAEMGYTPEAFKMQMEALRKFGRVYEIEDFDNKKRAKMGLSELETKARIEPLIPEKEER